MPKGKQIIYEVPMRLTYRTTVSVEASSEAEARSKAMQGDWQDDSEQGEELCDWEISGNVKDTGETA